MSWERISQLFVQRYRVLPETAGRLIAERDAASLRELVGTRYELFGETAAVIEALDAIIEAEAAIEPEPEAPEPEQSSEPHDVKETETADEPKPEVDVGEREPGVPAPRGRRRNRDS